MRARDPGKGCLHTKTSIAASTATSSTSLRAASTSAIASPTDREPGSQYHGRGSQGGECSPTCTTAIMK